MMLSASRTAARSVVGRRCLSTAPKMHKAQGNWEALKAKRPIDHDDTHLVFHPPFNPMLMTGLVFSIVAIGWGSMSYGFSHQQYKQGYYKK